MQHLAQLAAPGQPTWHHTAGTATVNPVYVCGPCDGVSTTCAAKKGLGMSKSMLVCPLPPHLDKTGGVSRDHRGRPANSRQTRHMGSMPQSTRFMLARWKAAGTPQPSRTA
jgi:hypothetical protein